MDFRVLVLSLLLWLLPFGASAIDPLDELTELVYQYPSKAQAQITALEKQFATSASSDINRLRLSVLKCQNLLQIGENEAAINLAQLGEANAKQLKLDQVRPYFLICQADANISYHNIQHALPLLDSAITLARRYQQPQALVDALRLRGQLDTDTHNFFSSIEDLRLAIDIYPDIHTQTQNWIWPPQAYVYAAMGNLLYATHDFSQAMYYTNLGIQSADAKGKVLHFILRNAARIALDNQEFDYSDKLEQQAKALLPELGSPLELAYSYAIFASIALDKGRIDAAEEYLSIAIDTFQKQNQPLAIMRSTRLLANIRFAQHQEAMAVILMNQAIEQAQTLKQYADLKGLYAVMSDHYLEQGDFKQAYFFLLKRYRAAELTHQAMSNTRILQFKARLNQQDSRQDTHIAPAENGSILNELNVNWAYSTLFLIAMALLAGTIWHLIAQQNNRAPGTEGDDPAETLSQQATSALNSAKQANYPLSLLLFNASQIRQVDLPLLQDQVQQQLREQDKLIRYSIDEIVIILPHTSATGAKRVVSQLVACIQPWQGSSKVNIGIAAMQQFDTLESLIKRASINQLGKVKINEHTSNHYSPAK
ncbi:MAG: diguanylate cyclase domain-containing protein [Shewanella sp.]